MPLSATIVPSSAIDGEKYGAPGRPLRVTATFREPSGRLIQTSPRLMKTIDASPAGAAATNDRSSASAIHRNLRIRRR